jgi:hypothetical protein
MLSMKNAFAGGLVLLASAAYAQESSWPQLQPLRATGAWEVGQIESFEKDAGGPVAGEDKQLINHSAVWLLQEARLSENARVYLGVGGMYFFILPSKQNQYSFGQRSAFGLTDAHAEFDFWTRENGDHGLRLKAGIFPFKYNEDAKNLGEYMYRTYTYPNIITTGGLVVVNSAGVQLNGVSAGTKIGGLKNDLLLTTKTDQVPSAALSVTDIVSYKVGNFLTLGAGYMFDNFYSADGIANGTAMGESEYAQSYYWVLADGRKVLYGSGLNPGDSVVDTKHFSFKGQKAVWRASLDLGNLITPVLPLPIASNTFKVYYEGVLMGVEDRPIFYDTLSHRIAQMFGVNIPTFGVLDVFSVEMEYSSNPYAPDMSRATLYLSATPVDNQGSPYTSDDLKWTVYARKTILPGFAVTAQAARDHTRLVDYFGHTNDMEVLPKRKNWYWALQMSYSI